MARYTYGYNPTLELVLPNVNTTCMPNRDDVSSIYENDNNVTGLSSDGIYDPKKLLNDLKIKNVNRIVIGQLNINSLRNKFEALKEIINKNIDILVITDTKIDNPFPTQQFKIYHFD